MNGNNNSMDTNKKVAEGTKDAAPKMKLNVKRTCFIGIAFFGILLLWGIYNSYCGSFLTYLFAEAIYHVDSAALRLPENQALFLDVQYLVGIIMALDNIAALFLMPIFGSLSDKTHTKLGRRMPFIIVGTVVSAIALPFIPLFFHLGMVNDNYVVGISGVICTMVVVLCFMMMYRPAAVALMPDVTPKPLRSKANGIINIIGYIGGAVAVLFGIIMPFSSYLDESKAANGQLWWLEVPFLVASVIMLLSLGVLLWKVKENKIASEMKEEMERGNAMSETVDEVKDDAPLSKANRKALLLILAAEVCWFMAFNAVETFMTSYTMFYLDSPTSFKSTLDLVNGALSAITFVVAGFVADKIGRKWTVLIGIGVVALCYFGFIFVPTGLSGGELTYQTQGPWTLFLIFGFAGIGSSLIHINSFPMVVDFCNSKQIGRFTSYYYAASMLAQSVTPILIGLIFKGTGEWRALPIYAFCFMALAFVIFLFVKAPKKVVGENKKGLEAFDAD